MADTIKIEASRDGLVDVPNNIKVERGTKVLFSSTSASSSVNITGFESTYWTKTNNAVLELGKDDVYYIKSNAPYGKSTLRVNDPVDGSKHPFTIEVVPSIDKPNPYYLGPTITSSYSGLNANEFVVSQVYRLQTESYTIVHLRSDDPEVRFRLVEYASNRHEEDFYGNWVTDFFMNSTFRRNFQIAFRAPTGSLESKTSTVRIGSRVHTVTLSTSTELVPANHHVINFGHTSGELSLLDVKGFFGGAGNLRDYFRKGRNVPDMPANSGIPTSGSIRLTDFRGAATAFFIALHPRDRDTRLMLTQYGDQSTGVGWNIWTGEADDWDLGYSKFIKDNAEFRYTLDYTFHRGYGTTSPFKKPTLSSISGNPGTWSSANKSVHVTVYGRKREEFFVTCTVTMYARHKDFPTKTLSTSAQVKVRCVGV